MVVEDCSYVTEMSLNFNPPQSHSIELFDPDLGDLVRVEVNLSVNWSEKINYCNLDDYAKEVNITSELALSVKLPDDSDLATNFTDLALHNVSAYSGSDPLACAPPEGFDYQRSKLTWSSSSYTEEEDLRAFTAADDADTKLFPITTQRGVNCDDHGNKALSILTYADSMICVKYTYDVSPPGETTSGGF